MSGFYSSTKFLMKVSLLSYFRTQKCSTSLTFDHIAGIQNNLNIAKTPELNFQKIYLVFDEEKNPECRILSKKT